MPDDGNHAPTLEAELLQKRFPGLSLSRRIHSRHSRSIRAELLQEWLPRFSLSRSVDGQRVLVADELHDDGHFVASAPEHREWGVVLKDSHFAPIDYPKRRACRIERREQCLLLTLDLLVGRSNVEPKGLTPPVSLPSITPADAEVWARNADAQHPSVRLAQLSLDVARLETSKARSGHFPTLDAVASVSSQYNSTGRSGSQLSSAGTTNTGSIGVQFNLPLFTGLSVQNRIKETLALEDKSQNDLEAARRAVSLSTRQAYFGVQSLQAQVLALEAAESSSALALEATQVGYRVGVRVNIDVLNAQTQLYTTRRDLSKARYDTLLGGLRLRQAAGQLKPEDVTAVSRLLTR